MDAGARSGHRGSAGPRPLEAAGPWPAGAAHRRIRRESRGEPARPGGGRAGHVVDLHLPSQWHAADDERLRAIEFIVTPDLTYILVDHIEHTRRVYTDGRDWPAAIEPSWVGYSIGRWIDEDGDGRFDALEVESRGFKGPRAYDASGLPLHEDNESVFKERLWLDRNNPNLLHDEVTTIDHALTRPWTVTKTYARIAYPKADWREWICGENNPHVVIGNDNYFLSADGLLMPARKDQAPPDLRYFKRAQK